MIHVIAVITTKPGLRDRVLDRFRANLPAVRAEAGCLEYGPAVDVESPKEGWTAFGPDSFVVIERWASVEALDAHARSPHMAAYAASVRDMIAGRAVHVVEPC